MDSVLTSIFQLLFGSLQYLTGIGTIPGSWNKATTLIDLFLHFDLFSWINKGGNSVSDALLPISTGFVILFWMYGLLKAEATLVDMKRPETIFKHLVRLAVAVFLINAIPGIVENIWTIGVNLGDIVGGAFKSDGSLATGVASSHPGAVPDDLFVRHLSYSLSDIPEDIVAIKDGGAGMSLIAMFWSFLLGWIITIGTRIAIIYVVYDILTSIIGRAFRLFLLYAVSPIAASAVAAEETQRVTLQFFKNAIAVSSEIAVTVLLLKIFPVVVEALFSIDGLIRVITAFAGAILLPLSTSNGTTILAGTEFSINDALVSGLGCALLFIVCLFTLKASIKGMNNILDSLFGLHGV